MATSEVLTMLGMVVSIFLASGLYMLNTNNGKWKDLDAKLDKRFKDVDDGICDTKEELSEKIKEVKDDLNSEIKLLRARMHEVSNMQTALNLKAGIDHDKLRRSH